MKNKWMIIILVAVLSLAGITATVIGYFITTYSADEMEEYCKENSTVQAEVFEAFGLGKLDGYRFWVADTETTPVQQEMFIFRRVDLWGIFDMNRYELINQASGSAGQQVSVIQLDVKATSAEEETRAVLFFSSNPSKITYYTIGFQEGGHFAKLEGGVGQEQPFVVGLLGLGSSEYLYREYEGAIFYDEEYNIIEEEGNVSQLK